MNDRDRLQWVSNDERLYLWWKDTKLGMRKFLRANRDEIDKFINAEMNKEPA